MSYMKDETFYLFISFTFFAVLHSAMATNHLKIILAKWWGLKRFDKYYRFVYSIISILSILPVAYFLFTTSLLLWVAPAWLAFALYFIKGVASVGFLYSLWQIDGLHFLGIRQLKSPRSNPSAQLSDTLVTSGVFSLCRHPLYFFSMLFLWASPTMTLHALIFTLLTSLYFIIGSYWEEAKMFRQFGHAYLRYQEQVPRFIPSLFIKRYWI